LTSTRRCWPSWWPTSVDDDFHFERQKVGTTPVDLRRLADWLVAHEVEEVVMESTAQYRRPVWEALEQHWRPRRRARDGASRLAGTLHLAQAQSNRGPGGRKKDFPDAERLVKRLVAQELTLSFVPDDSHRCPKGNRQMRRVLNQAANAAVKAKGTAAVDGPALLHQQSQGAENKGEPACGNVDW
jgi:hypothetical protein